MICLRQEHLYDIALNSTMAAFLYLEVDLSRGLESVQSGLPLRLNVQGIRRVIAVTASEAEEAVSKAEGLTKAMDSAEKLDGPKLDAEIASLRQV